ncbi:MAG: hypothetical protein ACI4JK_07810 [Oscillospiraceae bacterium]
MSRKGNLLSEIQKLDKITPTADEKTASEYLCADGMAQIDVHLYKDVDLFNPLSFGKQRDLNSDIYELIDTKLYTIPLKYPIRICFHGCIPDSQSQNEIRQTIQEHYMFLFRDKKEDLRLNLLKTIIMAIFGVILLAIYFTLELISSNPVFMEFLSIAGWVAAWEAVDSWLLQRKALRIEYLNIGQAALSEVSFSNENQ